MMLVLIMMTAVGAGVSALNPGKPEGKLILCPNDEIWINCKAGYSKPQYCREINTTLDSLQVPGSCPGGCICRDGLLRNDDEKCISEDQCPISKPCSDPNAIRKKCASHESCRATCAVPNSRVCPRICIIDGCECKRGYVLSTKGGKCVKIEDCPRGNASCNGDPNAEIRAFPQPCPSTCELPNGIPRCLKLGLDVGCECKPGYLKADDNGKCILPNDCKGGDPCGPNATFSPCRTYCPKGYCPVDDRKIITPCELPYPCPSGCNCKVNYKRISNDDDRCILSSTCPRVNCTHPNEIWDPCASECLRENCPEFDLPFTCNTPVLNCQPQCVCKKGYLRNRTICIPAKDCPNNKTCTDPNAERVQCAPATQCRPTCAVRNPGPCIKICVVDDCVCKKGYVLSENGGKCILENQCPSGSQCPDNEVYDPCPPINCPPGKSCAQVCSPTCRCADGLVRCKDGRCDKPEKCQTTGSQCPDNEVYDPCPPINCPPGKACAQVCRPTCRCADGLVRCKDGRCEKPEKCQNTGYQCPDNEVYDPCPPINCPPGYSCAQVCSPTCRCADGLVRCKDGRCAKPETCQTMPSCGINEHSESNSNTCQITCDNMRYEAIMGACAPTTDCYCNKGYVRNEEGICIKRKDCPPPKCPAGELWNECGSSCPPSCANRDNTCLVCTLQCVAGCFCAGDTVRAPNGSCVKPQNCPPRTCSGPNEVFNKCPSTCPRTDKCENLWSKIPCTPIDCCEPKCQCKPGYYRNDKNVCVTAKQCTKQCGPNEVFTECYNDCQKTCKNRFQRNPKVCPLVCNQTGCICKENYFRHDNGTCVPEYECSPAECGEGEVYSDCNSSCSELCEDRGNTCLACTAVCVPGCYCAKNTFRAAPNGKCVKPENCPPRICGRNEIFVKCPPTCPRTEECKNLWSKEPCTPIDCCRPSCRCKPGYYRNGTNCISAQECYGCPQCG